MSVKSKQKISIEIAELFKQNNLSPIEGLEVISSLFSSIFYMMNPDATPEDKKAMLEILFSNIRNDIVSKEVYYRGHD